MKVFPNKMPKVDLVCQICGLSSYSKDGSRLMFMSRYPNDPELAKKWVKVTGKAYLANYPMETLWEKFVCGNHFRRSDFTSSPVQLNPGTVPSLNLSRAPLSDDILAEFPVLPVRDKDGKIVLPTAYMCDLLTKVLHDHGYCISNVLEYRPIPAIESSAGSETEITEKATQALDDLPLGIQGTDTIECDNSKISPNETINENAKSTSSEPKACEKTKENKLLNRWLQHPQYQTITVTSGIYSTVLSDLKQKAEKSVGRKGTVCVLLFDEIKLQEHIYYNSYLGKVIGYVDLGEEGGRGKELANRALVFLKDNLVNYKKSTAKYPIAHYFYRDNISIEILSNILKTIITFLRDAGYTVIASICEDKQHFVEAMNLLKGETEHPDDVNYYFIDNEKVYIIYDVPRLFMTIRNNLIQYGEVAIDNKKLKWSHLIMAQEKNNNTYNFFKIKSHINKIDWSQNGIKLAIQIFSNTMAAILKLFSESMDNILDEEEIFNAGVVIEYLDKLFDCTNGSLSKNDTKQLRKYVSKNSNHHDLWIEFKRILSNTNFFIDDFHYLYNVRCIKSYITTISSLQDVWNFVSEKEFKSLNLRKLNLDTLNAIFRRSKEELLPDRMTCFDIEYAIVSNIIKISNQNMEANCTNENVLLHNFVNQKCNCIKNDLDLKHLFSRFDSMPIVYMSGYCASIVLHNVNCEQCKSALNVPEVNSIDKFNLLKQSWKEKLHLVYPNNSLCVTILKAIKAFERDVLPVFHIKNILNYSVMMMVNNCDITWMCKQHRTDMSKKLYQYLSYLLIRNNCRIKNEYFMEQIAKETADDKVTDELEF